jgi:uncharacterized protein
MYEWDENKNTRNIEKHGLGFLTAVRIFDGVVLSELDTRHDYSEMRWRSIGLVEDIVCLVVVHTDRDGINRIISARPANRKERKRYEQEIHRRTFP